LLTRALAVFQATLEPNPALAACRDHYRAA
jgi:hypothetical protein